MPQIPPIAVNDGRGANQPNPVPPNTPRHVQAVMPDQQVHLFDDDAFLPPTDADRVQLIPQPALNMAASADEERQIESITTANDFEIWLCNQALLWKTYIQAGVERKSEFFTNARELLAKTSLGPDERAKAIVAFKKAENLLDK